MGARRALAEAPRAGADAYIAQCGADLGAEVVRVERPTDSLSAAGQQRDHLLCGRCAVHTVDLKSPEGTELLLGMVEAADVLIEGFRPGVVERLGIGPDECLRRNQRLVYGRMTGWGQHGPVSRRAGHDINYISLTGVLHAIGHADSRPVPPLNLVGDFGGGSMFLIAGLLAALWERERSGNGQVVDAAMVDGTSALSQAIWAMRGTGEWSVDRAANLLDTGAPFYDTYACSDGKWVAVGAIEPQFYAELLRGLGLDTETLPGQHDRTGWPRLRARFTTAFASRTRDDWAKIFSDTDACVTPVLSFDEAADHPHLASRGTLITIDGVTQAAPAPRFSRTKTQAS